MIGSTLPLLFLDVDGPLIPFGATQQQLPNGYPTYQAGRQAQAADANPLITRIDPAHGPRLMALPCQLVWATTWMSDANECIAPWLGLPELPVVIWPEPSDEDEKDGLHWKTRDLHHWAAGRPFAWVDDEITAADRTWMEAQHAGQVLLHRVDPRQGITDEDFAALDHWLQLHRGWLSTPHRPTRSLQKSYTMSDSVESTGCGPKDGGLFVGLWRRTVRSRQGVGGA